MGLRPGARHGLFLSDRGRGSLSGDLSCPRGKKSEEGKMGLVSKAGPPRGAAFTGIDKFLDVKF